MTRRIAFVISLLLALATTPNVAWGENVASRRKVVVIDAGHGGAKFPGATYRGVCEKDLNLKVALKLGKLIEENMDDVDVVYTRTTDCQLSSDLNADLQKRTSLANSKRADLFISIHANAAKDPAACGTETIVMGESPKELSRNEDVVMEYNKDEFIDMSDENQAALVRAYIETMQFTYGEYSMALARLVEKNYSAIGRHSRGVKKKLLKVLYGTDMPSILTEIGFMSNSKEFAYINSSAGQNALAKALYNAVSDYFDFLRGNLTLDAEQNGTPAPTPAPAPKPVDNKAPAKEQPAVVKSGYTVQIMALAKKIPTSSSEFKSYKGQIRLFSSDLNPKFPYRYCIGDFKDKASADREAAKIRKTFKGAYVVRYRDGKIVK